MWSQRKQISSSIQQSRTTTTRSTTRRQSAPRQAGMRKRRAAVCWGDNGNRGGGASQECTWRHCEPRVEEWELQADFSLKTGLTGSASLGTRVARRAVVVCCGARAQKPQRDEVTQRHRGPQGRGDAHDRSTTVIIVQGARARVCRERAQRLAGCS